MEIKNRAREDRDSSSLVPFPTDARFPAQAIRASEFVLREREVEVGRNYMYSREVELRLSLPESTKPKAKGESPTSSSPTTKNTKHKAKGEGSTSSSPTTKKADKPKTPAKQVGQLNKSQNIVGNGESRADVKVRVEVKVEQDKNKVVVSSGTALKANKSGGNNKVIMASKGKPQGCVKKY